MAKVPTLIPIARGQWTEVPVASFVRAAKYVTSVLLREREAALQPPLLPLSAAETWAHF